MLIQFYFSFCVHVVYEVHCVCDCAVICLCVVLRNLTVSCCLSFWLWLWLIWPIPTLLCSHMTVTCTMCVHSYCVVFTLGCNLYYVCMWELWEDQTDSTILCLLPCYSVLGALLTFDFAFHLASSSVCPLVSLVCAFLSISSLSLLLLFVLLLNPLVLCPLYSRTRLPLVRIGGYYRSYLYQILTNWFRLIIVFDGPLVRLLLLSRLVIIIWRVEKYLERSRTCLLV